MFLKNRTESEELRILRVLNTRMELAEKERNYYLNLQKGYEGEIMFDGYLQRLKNECYVLSDLLLEWSHSHFQIDSLVILQNFGYLFEVKNFEGEYYFDDGKFKKINGSEVKNPILQLERNVSLLRQLLYSIGVKIHIEAYLVFVNPEFTLYQAPLDKRIILPTKLNRFIHQMDNQNSTLTNYHERLSEKLLSFHLTKSPFTKIPKYEYEQLRKGVFCKSCGSVIEEYHTLILTCKKCGKHENTKNALLRSIEDYQILYPTNRISTGAIHEWNAGVFPQKAIRQILKESFKVTGYGQWSYYE